MVVKNVLDGGLGTLVQSRGGFLSDDDLWVSSCLTTDKGRQELKRAHLDYLRAGADIIKTSSYQISVPLLRQSLPEITEVLSPVTFAVVLFFRAVEALRAVSEQFWGSYRGIVMFYQCNFWYRAVSEQLWDSYGAIQGQFQSNHNVLSVQFLVLSSFRAVLGQL